MKLGKESDVAISLATEILRGLSDHHFRICGFIAQEGFSLRSKRDANAQTKHHDDD